MFYLILKKEALVSGLIPSFVTTYLSQLLVQLCWLCNEMSDYEGLILAKLKKMGSSCGTQFLGWTNQHAYNCQRKLLSFSIRRLCGLIVTLEKVERSLCRKVTCFKHRRQRVLSSATVFEIKLNHGYFYPVNICCIMKINNCGGDFTDVSAKKEAMVLRVNCAMGTEGWVKTRMCGTVKLFSKLIKCFFWILWSL